MALSLHFIECADSTITLAQRPIVSAPTAFPMVALHRRLASAVWAANCPRGRFALVRGVVVARSNTYDNYKQEYDSENNESKHNVSPPIWLRDSRLDFSRYPKALWIFSCHRMTPFILHDFTSFLKHINRLYLLSQAMIIPAAVELWSLFAFYHTVCPIRWTTASENSKLTVSYREKNCYTYTINGTGHWLV